MTSAWVNCVVPDASERCVRIADSSVGIIVTQTQQGPPIARPIPVPESTTAQTSWDGERFVLLGHKSMFVVGEDGALSHEVVLPGEHDAPGVELIGAEHIVSLGPNDYAIVYLVQNALGQNQSRLMRVSIPDL